MHTYSVSTVSAYFHLDVYILTYIHTHTHTYTHTYIAVPEALSAMWAQLQGLEAVGKVLKLTGAAIFFRKPLQEVWIRDSYEKLFEVLLKLSCQELPQVGILVTGNPGIGKSFFLLYAMWRFAKLRKTIVFESAEAGKVYLLKPGQDPIVMEGRCTIFEELDSETTIFLHDPKPGVEPLHVNAFTILASSPNPSNYKGFSKRDNSEIFYLPVWTVDEIRSCNAMLTSWNLTDDQLTDGFSKFGGIPRFLLKQEKYSKALQAAITTCTAHDLL